MKPARYVIVQVREFWWIDFEGKPNGPFDSATEAVRNAIDIAHFLGDEERPQQVFVSIGGRKLQLAWSSEADQFPPDHLPRKTA